jgi:hypothetical protein
MVMQGDQPLVTIDYCHEKENHQVTIDYGHERKTDSRDHRLW